MEQILQKKYSLKGPIKHSGAFIETWTASHYAEAHQAFKAQTRHPEILWEQRKDSPCTLYRADRPQRQSCKTEGWDNNIRAMGGGGIERKTCHQNWGHLRNRPKIMQHRPRHWWHPTQLSNNDMEYLAKEFNASIQIKEDWLHGYLLPLPKPNKDHSQISTYRIITMQNTISKLLRKIVSPMTWKGIACSHPHWEMCQCCSLCSRSLPRISGPRRDMCSHSRHSRCIQRSIIHYLMRMLHMLEAYLLLIRWIVAVLF